MLSSPLACLVTVKAWCCWQCLVELSPTPSFLTRRMYPSLGYNQINYKVLSRYTLLIVNAMENAREGGLGIKERLILIGMMEKELMEQPVLKLDIEVLICIC